MARTDISLGRTELVSSQSSLLFDAQSEYVQWVDNAVLDLQEFTIEVWFRQNQTHVLTNDIVSKWKYADTGNQSYMLFINGSNKYECDVRTNVGVYAYQSGVTPNLGNWEHLVYTYKSLVMTFYLNGSLVGSDGASGANLINSNADLRLGSRQATSSGALCNLSRFRLFGTQANASQVSDLYMNNGLFASPIINCGFTEGSGSSLGSTGSYAVSGTISGATWSSEVPAPRTDIPAARTDVGAARTDVS